MSRWFRVHFARVLLGLWPGGDSAPPRDTTLPATWSRSIGPGGRDCGPVVMWLL